MIPDDVAVLLIRELWFRVELIDLSRSDARSPAIADSDERRL
jgi:hypothetical protein